MSNGMLYILSGSSGCGKTTLINYVCSREMAKDTNAVIAPKYSNRESRGRDDDTIYTSSIEVEEYDISYYKNERMYGIKKNEIWKLLNDGKNVFVVISDFRNVRRMKCEFKEKAVAIYISSGVTTDKLKGIQGTRLNCKPEVWQREKIDIQIERIRSGMRIGRWDNVFKEMSDLVDEWKKFIPEDQSTKVRIYNIRAIHTRYIDHIEMFDHVILNYSEGKPEEMYEQIVNIIKYYESGGIVKNNINPLVYVVAAWSGAGKGTLMEALNILGKEYITITSKMAKRTKKDNDKRDNMKPIGPDGVFPETYNIRWRFHYDRDEEDDDKAMRYKGVEYAVSAKEIEENIDNDVPQIFVSNIQQFDYFKRLYNGKVIFIYLHAVKTDEEVKKFQYEVCKDKEEAEARIKEMKYVHQDYIENIAKFNHVLLNTTFQEDLYDQMFSLLEYYGSRGC